jgi:hypothetical protein
MHARVLLEFQEEGVEGFEVVGRGIGIEVKDGGEREAEEEVVGRAASEVAWREGREACEIVFGEEKRVEPIDAALVTEVVS